MGWMYSSTLRSQLIAPRLEPPLGSLLEVVESDLPVKLNLVEDFVAAVLKSSNDPIHRGLTQKQKDITDHRGKVQIVNILNKLIVFLLPLQLQYVEEGKEVVVGWLSQLRYNTRVFHTTMNGEPVIHTGDDPLLEKSYIAVSFNKNKPWVAQRLIKLSMQIFL